jgi:hypothetical protein
MKLLQANLEPIALQRAAVFLVTAECSTFRCFPTRSRKYAPPQSMFNLNGAPNERHPSG